MVVYCSHGVKYGGIRKYFLTIVLIFEAFTKAFH